MQERKKMRTVIWSGTALVLLGTAGLFVAARQATQHPDSFVGRCVVSFYRVWSPMPVACGGAKGCAELAQAQRLQHGLTPAGKLTLGLDVIEPIVVDPTNEEPPLALPGLAPEVVA